MPEVLEYVLGNRLLPATHQDAGDGEDKIRVRIMTEEEFADGGDEFREYPYKREFADSFKQGAYCRTQVYGDCVLGVIRMPDKEKPENPADIFAYSVREKEVLLLDNEYGVQKYLEKVKEVEFSGEFRENHFLLALFGSLVDEEVPYLQRFEEEITELEDILLEQTPPKLPRVLMRLRKETMKLHTFYIQLVDMGEELQSGICEWIPKEGINGWSAFTSRVSRMHSYIENIRENLLQLRELYQSQIDIQQNEIMAVLTVVTTIFLPLSLLTGWYGMNFEDIPLLTWKYGYETVIFLAGLIIVGEIFYFRKKGLFIKRKKK